MQRRTFLQQLSTIAGTALTTQVAGTYARVKRFTRVAIDGERFLLNDRPTYEGRTWRGHRIEGLLMNARFVQGTLDDLNTETRSRWAYPDTGRWDPERNTREFLAAMPEWRRHGLMGFTLNLQGGSPQGYSRDQPWHNSAFEADGSLRPAYLNRLGRILDRPLNNLTQAISTYASWGYFDPGASDYRDGYQCPPINWGINTPRKRAFFELLKEITEA